MMFATPMHHQQFSFPVPGPVPGHSAASPSSSSPFTPVRPSPLSPRHAIPMTETTAASNTTSPASPTPPQSPAQSQSQSNFTFNFNFQPQPTTPSPSPRSHTHTSTPPTQHPTPTPTAPKSIYAHRYATQISNPLLNQPRASTASSTPAARCTRRNAFLNRVKHARDAGRFENRGEQLALMEVAAEEKRWGEAMRRRAEGLVAEGWRGDFDLDLGVEGEGDGPEGEEEGLSFEDELALNEYLRLEDAAHMGPFRWADPGQANGNNGYGHTGSSPVPEIGSFSDEEYDDIFMDLAQPPSQDMDMTG